MSGGSKHEIIIAGRGGQGIQLAGYILGKALVEEGYYVVNSEEYSAETRGGDSKAELIVSRDEEPDLMSVRRADIAVFMYGDQMSKYFRLVGEGATLILDSTFIREPPRGNYRVLSAPFTDVAEKQVGNVRTANMVALGYFAARTGLVGLDSLIASMKSVTNPKWVEINEKALRTGHGLQRRPPAALDPLRGRRGRRATLISRGRAPSPDAVQHAEEEVQEGPRGRRDCVSVAPAATRNPQLSFLFNYMKSNAY